MFQLTLQENRSTPRRFVPIVRYEREGDPVTPVRYVYDGPNHCASVSVIGWPRKDWAPVHNEESGTHGLPFTIKRDWLRLHESLRYERECVATREAA